MPFVNFKLPEAALTRRQKEEIVHRTTAMLVDYFGDAARPHTMVLIEEVPDGGYARADEVFVIPDQYRARLLSASGVMRLEPGRGAQSVWCEGDRWRS